MYSLPIFRPRLEVEVFGIQTHRIWGAFNINGNDDFVILHWRLQIQQYLGIHWANLCDRNLSGSRLDRKMLATPTVIAISANRVPSFARPRHVFLGDHDFSAL